VTRPLRFVRGILDPARYHGGPRTRGPFFEGWYYKLVDASGEVRRAVIPGIFLGEDASRSHAFVQTLDGVSGRSTYHAHPLESFRAAPDRFEVSVGPNRFAADRVELALDDEQLQMRGTLRFEGVRPWPVRWHSPGIMGWYAWVPRMECYHGVVSLDHAIAGELRIGRDRIDFSGGRGYTEKDWGTAFPGAYVWMQSNHFARPGVSLTASVAMIPWVRRAFRGFIVGLWLPPRLYRFATYTGARIESLTLDDAHVVWSLADRRHRLELRALRTEGGLLHSPVRTEMHRRVDETLRSRIGVRLFALRRGRADLLFDDTGFHAGLEVHGDLPRLLAG
jgi:hypothetical protein